MYRLLLLLVMFSFGGCFYRPTEVIPRQNTPMMIAEVKSHYARVYAYDANAQSMIEIGWIDITEHEGWTLSNFDWSTYIGNK